MSEIIFASSLSVESRRIHAALEAGQLRQLAPRIYTNNLVDDAAAVIRRNLFGIAAHRFPDSVISHRSALKPESIMADGVLFLTSPGASQTVEYPGAFIQHSKGHGPQPGDKPFLAGGLYLSSAHRALLDNCSRYRSAPGRVAKVLGEEEMEIWLERLFQLNGGGALNRLRDESNALAEQMNMHAEAARLNRLIAATLGTAESTTRASGLARARVKGLPYDPERVAAFQAAASALATMPLPSVSDPLHSPPLESSARQHRAFFDAYFSNFIEGTEFEVEEAERIVFEGHRPAHRPLDAHDITASFELMSKPLVMPAATEGPSAWIATLRRLHGVLMADRDDVRPGFFKDRPNRVGLRRFVAPEAVEGTLFKGFELGAELTEPFARACFWKLVVTEVHPFNDGNGRISRIVLNHLLGSAGLAPVIIPNVYREDYVTALSAFTNTGRIEPLIMVLHRAQLFTIALDFEVMESAKAQLDRRNAFASPSEAKLLWGPIPPDPANDAPLPDGSASGPVK